MAKLKADEVAAKIKEFNGNLAAVARALGVSRVAVWKFVKARESLQAITNECRESMKDSAESALYSAVLAGEAWAICFYLKCQAKDRGYVERSEHEHSGEVRQRVIEEVIDDSGGRHDNPAAPSAESVPPE